MKELIVCSRLDGVNGYPVTPLQHARTLKAALLPGTATNSVRLVEVTEVYRVVVIGMV